jgi:hypothetical protein
MRDNVTDAARDGITPQAAERAARSKAGDITIDEAKKILGIKPPITLPTIEEVCRRWR